MKGKISEFIDAFKNFLLEKNKKYGNSVLEPIRIFSKHIGEKDTVTDLILIRLDDKLSRINNSTELSNNKNDIVDIMGYLVFLGIKYEINFSDYLE